LAYRHYNTLYSSVNGIFPNVTSRYL